MHLLVLGTHNRKKGQELAQLLAPFGFELKTLADFSSPLEVEETGRTFAENAALKAVQQARHLHAWAIGFMSTRYTAIPLAGFLMIVAAVAGRAVAGAGPGRSRLVRVVVGLVVVILAVADLFYLRAEVSDRHRLQALHDELLDVIKTDISRCFANCTSRPTHSRS